MQKIEWNAFENDPDFKKVLENELCGLVTKVPGEIKIGEGVLNFNFNDLLIKKNGEYIRIPSLTKIQPMESDIITLTLKEYTDLVERGKECEIYKMLYNKILQTINNIEQARTITLT